MPRRLCLEALSLRLSCEDFLEPPDDLSDPDDLDEPFLESADIRNGWDVDDARLDDLCDDDDVDLLWREDEEEDTEPKRGSAETAAAAAASAPMAAVRYGP